MTAEAKTENVAGGGLLRPLDQAMEEEMVSLYQNIQSILADKPSKVVQFIGPRGGEGVSLLIREFAKTAALKFNARVLLLDANSARPAQAAHFGLKPALGWEEAVAQNRPLRETVCAVSGTRLSVSQVSKGKPSMLFDAARLEGCFADLRKDFDFILVDSPPATEAEGFAFSYRVDGVIVVVEAEETRWQVAGTMKERIEKLGGRILGVILNKRRHHIPKFLYERM